MRLTLGLDGGGTKTAAVILNEDGAEIGRGFGGACNIATTDDATLERSLREALSAACKSAGLREPRGEEAFAGVCAGVAGYSVPARRVAFQRLLEATVPAAQYRVEPDYVAAYWGASEGEPGIVLIAGTGSVLYGCNAEGKSVKIGGRGYLLDSAPSGFVLACRALNVALDACGVGERDALTQAILRHTQSETAEALIQWTYQDVRPGKIASLAPVVGDLAAQGDRTACALLDDLAQGAAALARRARSELGEPETSPLYLLGGLWELGDGYLKRAASRCEGVGVLAEPKRDAAYGAAVLARRIGLDGAIA